MVYLRSFQRTWTGQEDDKDPHRGGCAVPENQAGQPIQNAGRGGARIDTGARSVLGGHWPSSEFGTGTGAPRSLPGAGTGAGGQASRGKPDPSRGRRANHFRDHLHSQVSTAWAWFKAGTIPGRRSQGWSWLGSNCGGCCRGGHPERNGLQRPGGAH